MGQPLGRGLLHVYVVDYWIWAEFDISRGTYLRQQITSAETYEDVRLRMVW